MRNERANQCQTFRYRRTTTAILLSMAALLASKTNCPAQMPADLVGKWDIKDGKGNKIATLDLRENGQFEMKVGNTTFRATPIATWEFDKDGNLHVVYDPNGRGKQVYIFGKIKKWTVKDKTAVFELTLREVARIPAKEGDVITFEK